MKIITDSASNLSVKQAAGLGVEVVPFKVTFNGMTYRDGVDILPIELYQQYSQHPEEYPVTSQPSAGDFAAAYERFKDEEILVITLSTGLSGSYNSANAALEMVDSKNITVWDSRTVGAAQGWVVEMAAYGVQHGWSKEQILEAMTQVRDHTLTMVAISDIKYLVRSGRVTHLKAIIASILKIKPILGVNETDGRFSSLGQDMLIGRLLHKMVTHVQDRFGSQPLRLQLMHGNNLAGVAPLRQALQDVFSCTEDEVISVSTVLGAHAGPTVIGLAAIPLSVVQALMPEKRFIPA